MGLVFCTVIMDSLTRNYLISFVTVPRTNTRVYIVWLKSDEERKVYKLETSSLGCGRESPSYPSFTPIWN
jgi:hypothetical protein